MIQSQSFMYRGLSTLQVDDQVIKMNYLENGWTTWVL